MRFDHVFIYQKTEEKWEERKSAELIGKRRVHFLRMLFSSLVNGYMCFQFYVVGHIAGHIRCQRSSSFSLNFIGQRSDACLYRLQDFYSSPIEIVIFWPEFQSYGPTEALKFSKAEFSSLAEPQLTETDHSASRIWAIAVLESNHIADKIPIGDAILKTVLTHAECARLISDVRVVRAKMVMYSSNQLR